MSQTEVLGVVSLNLNRRHLSESQRAMVAASLATLMVGTNQHAQICAPSQNAAAELLQVSPRSVATAAKTGRLGSVSQTEVLGVVSLNMNRRHLSESQRAMVAASLETMQHGGDRKSAKQDANLHLDRHQAAELLQVSPRSVATAAKTGRLGSVSQTEGVETLLRTATGKPDTWPGRSSAR